LVPNFDPPLPEDAIQRARNRAHAKGVKKKEEGKKKKETKKARRKEKREKRQKLQQQAGEEESSSIDEDDDEGGHPYDWLDSMVEEGSSPGGRPSRSRGGCRRLNCYATNQRTPTLGELWRQVKERSPRDRRGRPVLRGRKNPDPRRGWGHHCHSLSLTWLRPWWTGRGLVL
jgi:hypothetical protein